ncbi:hypothetical protein [Kribbella sp. NPDC051620]|uniref:hypothetical protein n=1 Tax=Kribbella sp. NPDC051620 TaxID=3364120 RepID=UPI0037B797E0
MPTVARPPTGCPLARAAGADALSARRLELDPAHRPAGARGQLPLQRLAALYVVAVCTPWGQSAENSLLVGYADPALIFHTVYSVGPPPLKFEELTTVVGLTLILLVALLRRQWILAVAGLGVPVATFAWHRPSDAIGAICGGARTDSYPRSFVFIATGLLCAVIVWFTVARRSPADVTVGRTSPGDAARSR